MDGGNCPPSHPGSTLMLAGEQPTASGLRLRLRMRDSSPGLDSSHCCLLFGQGYRQFTLSRGGMVGSLASPIFYPQPFPHPSLQPHWLLRAFLAQVLCICCALCPRDCSAHLGTTESHLTFTTSKKLCPSRATISSYSVSHHPFHFLHCAEWQSVLLPSSMRI